MKPHQPSAPVVAPEPSLSRRQQAQQRRTWTILFAIILASIASVSSAQSCQTLQSDGASTVFGDPTPIASDFVDPFQVAGGAIATNRLGRGGRPVSAELVAELANFDADADPDGWRAEVVLRDRMDRPVVMRAQAVFELMPRIPLVDGFHFADATDKPIRWSMPLAFDEDSVARIKLPLRQSLRPMLEWTSVSDPRWRVRTPRIGDTSRRWRTFERHRNFVTLDLQTLLGTPTSGELRVRVSVPTEGVFAAAVPVRLRPSVLVDTNWPYR